VPYAYLVNAYDPEPKSRLRSEITLWFPIGPREVLPTTLDRAHTSLTLACQIAVAPGRARGSHATSGGRHRTRARSLLPGTGCVNLRPPGSLREPRRARPGVFPAWCAGPGP